MATEADLIKKAAWCGNSLYHDDFRQGIFAEACGACKRNRQAIDELLAALRASVPAAKVKPWCQICGKETPVYCADCQRASTQDMVPAAETPKQPKCEGASKHVWSNRFDHDLIPSKSTPCDCGQACWTGSGTLVSAPAETPIGLNEGNITGRTPLQRIAFLALVGDNTPSTISKALQQIHQIASAPASSSRTTLELKAKLKLVVLSDPENHGLDDFFVRWDDLEAALYKVTHD